jgi:hypothetical protein
VVKKRHTVKNNLIGDVEERLVRYLSETYPGRIHDKRICDAEEPVFPSDIGLFQDTGFQGYHPAGVHIYQPKKKPKGKELTSEEKVENKIISSIRILMEHIPTTLFNRESRATAFFDVRDRRGDGAVACQLPAARPHPHERL